MKAISKMAIGAALGCGVLLASREARADCFDRAYNLYVNNSHLRYKVVSTRNDGGVGTYSEGELAAPTATLFRSGPRGGVWTAYPFYWSPSTPAVGSEFMSIDFSTRTVFLSVPAWSYSASQVASCVGDMMLFYDGLNASLISFWAN